MLEMKMQGLTRPPWLGVARRLQQPTPGSPLSLFYPPFRKRSQTHILPLSPLIFPLIFLSLPPLSCSRSPSLHLDVVSVYQDRLEVAAAIFRWQHPPSLPPSFPPSLPPSLPLSISRSKSPPRLFAFSVYLPLFQHIRLSLATPWL